MRKSEVIMTDGTGEMELTHIAPDGRAHMVDVSSKDVSLRVAEAEAQVDMLPSTLLQVREHTGAKGDVLGVARIAGILAAKRTSELIPLCHGLPLDHVDVDFELNDEAHAIVVKTRATTRARTGVEMEALTAASVAALTIYDMLKAVDRGMTINGLGLRFKSGGKSGTYRRDEP
jgi:cyclic pyranopterin phosphate synthase